jgi:hypothetical protein
MNILIDDLPTAVLVNGKEYEINSDFRVCLRVILAFEDSQLTGLEKQMVMISNLYPQPPDDLQSAMEQSVKFLNGGKVSEGENEVSPRLYSFDKDAEFIFAAFRQTHNIDLKTTDLHWWEFLSLFMDLGPDTTFCSLIGLRKRIKDGTATKEERKAAREMGELVNIPEPDTRTPEEVEREDEFLRLVEQANKRDGK